MRITTGRKKIRVGDLLVEAGAITQDQLDQALAKQKEDGGRLGTVLQTLWASFLRNFSSQFDNTDGH